MLEKVKSNIFILFIFALAVLLAFFNYTPDTFLSGWDTLHPEFNFGLNISREINGVFRTEQGLGAVAAHSHMADLPRVLILYFLHFILPIATLRYFYIFLNLIAGPVGMYFFLNKFVVKDKIASFLGSIFYLLNLGTMQIFIVPFEMFTVQYALLPWLFFFATEYIYSEKKSINKLLLFALATLLATPMAFAATLWYVYFFIFIAYLSSLNLFDRSFQSLKRSLTLILITVAVNSFWILPNLYFVLNHAKDVSEALINKLFSSQAFLYNKEFGNIKDIAFLKNFLFDWNVYAGKDGFIPLLSPWIKHLQQISVQIIGFLLAIIAFAGLIKGVFKKNKILISILFPFLFCLFFLINDNPPTSFLYNFLQDKIPLFKEVFRFPDNKVLGIFIFVFAVYFAQGQEIIIRKLQKIKFVYLFICLFVIFFYTLPAFKGNLISPFMRVFIPKDYFNLFEWFDSQDKTARIANLPIHSVFGWEYYSWHDNEPSFQGSGFLPFGIQQPILNRDYDRWNGANEQYYREMSHAIYSQDSKALKNVLRKYNISYILIDKNIIAPEQGANSQVLFFDEIEKLLGEATDIQQAFRSGKLFVYRINNQNQKVRTINNPVSVGPGSSVSYDDFAYAKYNDYITYLDPKKNTIIYPFRNIIDNENRLVPNLILPSPLLSERLEFDVKLTINPTNDCSPQPPRNSKAKMEVFQERSGEFLRYISPSGSLCNHYSLFDPPRDRGYLISVVSKNISGLPLKLCVSNYTSKRCDLFTQLSSFANFTEEIFLLPPMEKDLGFDLNFNNFAIEKSPAVNDLRSVKITSFPYSEISQIEQFNPVVSAKDASFIVSSESFEKGWKAYEVKSTNWLTNVLSFLFGNELKEHVLVNNWANGWLIDNNSAIKQSNNFRIVIIFWPQYLEYLGLAILIGTFAFLILKRLRSST